METQELIGPLGVTMDNLFDLDPASLDKEAKKKHSKMVRQEWGTPLELFAALDAEFAFDVDVCARESSRKCNVWFGHRSPYGIDGLKAEWTDYGKSFFCNPGFSNPLPWVVRMHEMVKRHPSNCGVVLGIPSIASQWYRFAFANGSECRGLSPRPQYVAPKGVASSDNNRDGIAFVFRGMRCGEIHTSVWEYLDVWEQLKAENR